MSWSTNNLLISFELITMASQAEIAKNLTSVRESIAAAAKAAGRDVAGVQLVAVSKTHPPETVELALAAGQIVFGENRVQEAEAKWPALKAAYRDAKVHLIGPLQRNKAALAVDLFDVIETVDRSKLASALARHMDASGNRPDCFIQVNTGEEPQKAGILPADLDQFVKSCRDDFNLPLKGLMCIPPIDEEPSLHFGFLGELAKRNGLTELSMGMSADYEIAITFGATLVRVGTAIFGTRQTYGR
jgi:pyridoxal phosphate enzyme (YggS family)